MRRNAIFSSASASWGVYALAFAIIVLLMRLLFPNLFWYTFSPLINIGNTFADRSHAFIVSFSDTSELALRNEELAKENEALANENSALIKKGESLSALLGISPAPLRGAGILAAVVSRPPESTYDILLVSAGSDDGVKEGMQAFGLPTGQARIGGIPIGVVSSVMDKYSRITLFSAPKITVNGWVGKSNLPIIIRGEGGGSFSALASRSANIIVSDIVYAPGPGMLPIGKVVRVDNNPSLPSVTLRIQSSVNLFSLGWIELRDTGITLP